MRKVVILWVLYLLVNNTTALYYMLLQFGSNRKGARILINSTFVFVKAVNESIVARRELNFGRVRHTPTSQYLNSEAGGPTRQLFLS